MRRQKLNKIYSLLFLAGYLSFLGLSIFHSHPGGIPVSKQEQVAAYGNETHEGISDAGHDCPICHLFFSINVCPKQPSAQKVFVEEIEFLVKNDVVYKTKSVGFVTLRGPPSNYNLA